MRFCMFRCFLYKGYGRNESSRTFILMHANILLGRIFDSKNTFQCMNILAV